MQLEKIQGISFQVCQAALDECREIIPVVPVRDMWLQASSGLGCNVNLFAVFGQYLGDETFAAPIAVYVSSVEEVNSVIKCRFQDANCVFVGYRAPLSAKLLSAETHL